MVSSVTCKPGFSKLPPEAPVVLSATGVSDSQIDLIWRDNSTRETGYIIERSNDQTTWIEIAKTLADATTYSDLGLACDATYHYRVTAYNISGQSTPSNIGSAVIACPVLPPVTPPPVVDPVPPPVVPPTPPVTDPTPPTPPTEPTTPPGPETPPTEPPVTEPTEPTTPPGTETPPTEPPVVEPTEPPPVEPPEPPVVPEPPAEPPVEPTNSSDRPQGTETSTELPCPTDRHLNIHLDEACNAEGKTIENFKVVYGGSLANAIITGMLTSDEGLVSNLTIESTAILEGGYVTNFIINNGLMKNFTFVGKQIKGGTLSGIIIIGSQVTNEIRDVTLAAGTVIQGKIGEEFVTAKLAGKITGDPANPAKLENVTITAGTQLDNVILGKDAILEEGVILGENVTFSDGSQPPEEPTTCEPNALGLDENGKEVKGLKSCFALQPGNEHVEISMQVDPAHVGQKADLLFVIKASATEWYTLDKTTWKAWNGNLDSLKVKESFKKLPETIVLEFSNTEFNELGSELTLFVGYQLPDGTIVYNQGESL